MSTSRAAAVLTCALLLAGCGASAGDFRQADPTGYEACEAFADSLGTGGSVRGDALDRAATLGVDGETSGIRIGVDDRNGGAEGAPVIASLSTFENACKDAGFNF